MIKTNEARSKIMPAIDDKSQSTHTYFARQEAIG